MDLNKIIGIIQGYSDTEPESLKNLKTQLTKHEDVFVKGFNMLDDALNILDPNKHSFGWLFILYVFYFIRKKLFI